jgi:hypothetical protein
MLVFKKILGYIFTVFIANYIVSIVAGKFGWEYLSNNPLFFLVPIIVFGFLYLTLIIAIKHAKISINDINSLKKILLCLDKDEIENILHKRGSNIGYNINTTIKHELFRDAIDHIDNRITNKNIMLLLGLFAQSLKEYFDLYGDNSEVNNNIVKIYPEYKEEKPEKYDSLIKELDTLGDKAYKDFDNLISYIKQKGYSIYN